MPRINMLTSKAFRFVINNDTGATAIEYGLLAALISVVIIAAVTLVGTDLKAVFTAVSTALEVAL
jgi:pilus assembly protein Flp/PilA